MEFLVATVNARMQSTNLRRICCVNQLTGFYMRATLALNGLNVAGVLETPLRLVTTKNLK